MLFDYNVRYQSLSDIDPTWPIGASFPDNIEGAENLRRLYGRNFDARIYASEVEVGEILEGEDRGAVLGRLQRRIEAMLGEACELELAETETGFKLYAFADEGRMASRYSPRYSVAASVPRDGNIWVLFMMKEDSWVTKDMTLLGLALRGLTGWLAWVGFIALTVFAFVFPDVLDRFNERYEWLVWPNCLALVMAYFTMISLWGHSTEGLKGSLSRIAWPTLVGSPWALISILRTGTTSRRPISPSKKASTLEFLMPPENRVDLELDEMQGRKAQIRFLPEIQQELFKGQYLEAESTLKDLGRSNPLWIERWGESFEFGGGKFKERIARRAYPYSYFADPFDKPLYVKRSLLLLPAHDGQGAERVEALLRAAFDASGSLERVEPLGGGDDCPITFYRSRGMEFADVRKWSLGVAPGVIAFVDDKARIHLAAVSSEISIGPFWKSWNTRVAIANSLFPLAALVLLVVVFGGGILYGPTEDVRWYRYALLGLPLVASLIALFRFARSSFRVWRRLFWHFRNDGLYTYRYLLTSQRGDRTSVRGLGRTRVA